MDSLGVWKRMEVSGNRVMRAGENDSEMRRMKFVSWD